MIEKWHFFFFFGLPFSVTAGRVRAAGLTGVMSVYWPMATCQLRWGHGHTPLAWSTTSRQPNTHSSGVETNMNCMIFFILKRTYTNNSNNTKTQQDAQARQYGKPLLSCLKIWFVPKSPNPSGHFTHLLTVVPLYRHSNSGAIHFTDVERYTFYTCTNV